MFYSIIHTNKCLKSGESVDLFDKLEILSDSAKYDVACTSSGTDRASGGEGIATPPRAVYATASPPTADAYPC